MKLKYLTIIPFCLLILVSFASAGFFNQFVATDDITGFSIWDFVLKKESPKNLEKVEFIQNPIMGNKLENPQLYIEPQENISKLIPLGSGLTAEGNFNQVLTSQDFSFLQKKILSFQDQECEISDELRMPLTTDPYIATSLTSSEDDYKTNIFLELLTKDSMIYEYKFDSPCDLTVANLEEPFEMNFMGKLIRIIEIINDDTLKIEYDGIQKIVIDNDPFIYENSDDPDWRWNIEGLLTTHPVIWVENDFQWNDEADNPIGIEECLTLPFNFLDICLDGLNVVNDPYKLGEPYVDYIFKLDDNEPNTLIFYSSLPDGFVLKPTNFLNSGGTTSLTENKKVKWISIKNTGIPQFFEVNYLDAEVGQVLNAGTIKWLNNGTETILAEINYENTKGENLVLKTNGYTENNNITLKLAVTGNGIIQNKDDIIMQWGIENNNIISLGKTSGGIPEGQELKTYMGWNNYEFLTNVGSKDEDHRTRYGIIIKNPKIYGKNNMVKLKIPPEQVKTKVIIKKGKGILSGEDIKPPVITIVNPKSDTEIVISSITIKAITDEPATCQYDLCKFNDGGNSDDEWCTETITMANTGEMEHTQLISDLTNTINNEIQTEFYRLQILCTDQNQNTDMETNQFYVTSLTPVNTIRTI